MRSIRNPRYTEYQSTGGAVPLAPSQVTSIAVDAGANISWVNPGSGPSAAHYVVTPYIAGAAQAATTVSAPATSAAVTGLTNSTAYTFTVKATNSSGSSAESVPSGANTPLLNLIFGDDFTCPTIDPHWIVATRDGDQSAPESQYYLPSQVTLDGTTNVVITTAANSTAHPTYNDANPPFYTGGGSVTRPFISGMIQWQPGGFSFTYGIIQGRIKVSGGSNMWPALWTLGTNCGNTNPYDPNSVGTCAWPGAGSEEIDVMEYTGQSANVDGNYFGPGGSAGGPTAAVSAATTTYHTYEVDWSAGSLVWKLDGSAFASYGTSITSSPACLILQTACRGTATLTQPVLSCDWIRVFHN